MADLEPEEWQAVANQINKAELEVVKLPRFLGALPLSVYDDEHGYAYDRLGKVKSGLEGEMSLELSGDAKIDVFYGQKTADAISLNDSDEYDIRRLILGSTDAENHKEQLDALMNVDPRTIEEYWERVAEMLYRAERETVKMKLLLEGMGDMEVDTEFEELLSEAIDYIQRIIEQAREECEKFDFDGSIFDRDMTFC